MRERGKQVEVIELVDVAVRYNPHMVAVHKFSIMGGGAKCARYMMAVYHL